MFKFDEHQQTCLQQNQRKDSASSEVAALLCISGRTSRISSVGSQGSAVSRLSAMSGVSRSPSPHKMILETSFCGPKPLDNIVPGGLVSSSDPPNVEILEQVLLARKHDPTQAILAEGVHIDTSTPKKFKSAAKPVGNGNVADHSVVKVEKPTKPSTARIAGKSSGVLKASSKPIVGKTTSGVEYIRIKLKPDHLYSDKGLAKNERVLDENVDSVKKPASLSLGKDTPSKKAAPHFSQLVKTDDAITKHPDQVPPSASPKTARHIALRDSRSPSPATAATVSRKSSFCSLFKSKEIVASPESPTVINQRKKSGISLLSDSPRDRDRSRSKSRESDRGTSQNNTPSKQKSVLAIFKPKRSGSKSKSSSPVDPEAMDALDSVDLKYNTEPSPSSTESRPRSRLRYYDPPLDGKTIHIPLHTPPDEKENNICTVNVIKERRQQNEQLQSNAAKQPQAPAPPKELIMKQKPKPPTEKVYRIENADGSIYIPLKSPTDDNHKADEDSMWSVEANKNSSLDSGETVISSQAPSNTSTDVTYSHQRKLSKTSLKDTENLPSNDGAPITPNTSIASISSPVPNSFVTPAFVQTQTTTTAATTVPATSATTTTTTTAKEKRRILFCTKIGSGSQEQIFATQLSLSKTESLCSQLSEQASILESPVEAREITLVNDVSKEEVSPVPMRKRDSFDKSTKGNDTRTDSKDKFDKSNRHSKYIDNIDEIMAVQKQLEEERQESIRRGKQNESADEYGIVLPTTRKPDPVLQIPGPPPDRHSTSAEERCGSSESELDSELQSSELTVKHLRNPVGTVEEESARLVEQGSFDELPYVPTTLPEERPVGIAIVPVKERSLMEMKTCPVERPRSTTPLNPCHLEEYCGFSPQAEDHDGRIVRGEKLRISLPRKEAKEKPSKSPRRTSNTSGKSWFEFAEQGIGNVGSDRSDTRNSNPDEDPPPLPPRKPQNVSQWINFENIPEKRKQPKRITTLPNKESSYDKNAPHQIQYNYVNPDECQCECHEIERDGGSKGEGSKKNDESENEDTLPLLEGDGSDGANRASARYI